METLILSELCSILDISILDLDLQASFIQNGGHSLAAAALVSACKARGYRITSKSVLTSSSIREVIGSASPTMSDFATELPVKTSLQAFSEPAPVLKNCASFDQVAPSMPSSIARLHSVVQNGRTSHHLSTPSNVSSPKPRSGQTSPSPVSSVDDQETQGVLTDMQLSLIHGTLKTPGMNIITYSETYYTKDVPIVKIAWKTVIDMEPIFHSPAFDDFRSNNGDHFLWHEESSLLNDEETRKTIDTLRNASGIGSVFYVFPRESKHDGESLSTITWVVHHAFVDGFSASLLLDKVRRITAGIPVKPSPPFSRFTTDLQELRRSRNKEGNAYWMQKLELMNSTSGQLLLPAITEDLAQAPCEEIVIDIEALRNGFSSFAREMNVTPATLFNAAWALVLSKYSDSSTIKFGVVLSGRDLPVAGVRDIIGPLMNILPLCIEIDPGSSAKSFISLMMATLTELGEVQWTTPENGFCNDFESALAVQFDQMEPPKDSIRPIEVRLAPQAVEIPLSIMVEHESKVRFVFHTNKYSKADMVRVGTCYYKTLQLLLHRDNSIDGILQGLLPLSSRDMLLKYGNCISDRTTKTSITQDLVTLFEQSVRMVPDSLAVERGDESLTYANLDYAASRLAEYLSERVRACDIVCVHSDRSINWIVAIYGILKAGATYCSLDSGLPPELRDTMFTNAGARTFILPYGTQRSFCPLSCEYSIALDECLEKPRSTKRSVLSHRKEPTPWSAAYLCFTSGSTGTPKGVLCTHGGLVAFQSELEVRLYAQPGIKVSQVMSPAFDGSIHEIFSTLSYGATLVLPLQDDLFGHLVSVDSALLTPSIARVIDPERYHRLSNVYLVGEPVPQSVNEKWSKCKNLYNMYGPTEGTCGATIKRLMPDSRVTIGKPNPTTRLYILDFRRNLAFPGVIGEIYIAGIQVATGYLNLPEETRDGFLPDHIMSNGEKMYRTGDKGYWNESGEVVCLGRNDRQIKLRGYRLDMNDLEIRVARASPELEAIAISPQGDHLVAMVQPASIDISSLLSQMSMILPSYAVPQYVMSTNSLPITRGGKIDYKTISEMVYPTSMREMRGPSTSSEKSVAAAFKAVLELDKRFMITSESNFIDLGGHSLQQLSLSLHLTREFGVHIPLQLVIEHPTVEELAKAIDLFMLYKPPPVACSQPLDMESLSPTEEDWLNRYQLDAGSSCFNVSFASTFACGPVDRTKLVDAWNTVLARHPLLSCRYITRRGKAPRRVYSDYAPRVERVKSFDLWAEVNRPFQLDRTSPIRIHIAEDRLVVVLSHIVADYTTLAILLKEASTLYNGLELPPVRRDYLNTLRSREATKPCHLEFWSKYLDGCEESPALFGRKTERNNYRGTSVVSQLSPATVAKILTCANSTSVTLQHLGTGAVALCLQQPEIHRTDIVIGTPHINRDTDEALETVGLFLQPLPIRIKYDPSVQKQDQDQDQNQNQTPISFLNSVRDSSQAALAHAVPWHQLLAHLAVSNSYPNHPLSDVMVSFHDSRQATSLSIAAPSFEPCLLWSEGSKFKLMCEFTALPCGSMLLRLEYDPDCVKVQEVAMLQRCVPQVLKWLAEGWGYEAIQRRLRESRGVGCDGVVKRNYFGIKLSEIRGYD